MPKVIVHIMLLAPQCTFEVPVPNYHLRISHHDWEQAHNVRIKYIPCFKLHTNTQ